MRFRKLRIGWSVVWGVLAVLLGVFWVRSFWWRESVVYRDPPRIWAVAGNNGKLQFQAFNPSNDLRRSLAFHREESAYETGFAGGRFGFKCISGPGAFILWVPFWLPLIGSIALGAASQIRWSK